MPIQLAPIGLSGSPVPCQVCRPASPSALCRTVSNRPSMPPTWISPRMVSGMRPARMTKNCSTSL